MPATTLPLPRRLPSHLARAVAAFVGPVPRYAPGERAASCGIGPRVRAGGTRLSRLHQLDRIRAPRV